MPTNEETNEETVESLAKWLHDLFKRLGDRRQILRIPEWNDLQESIREDYLSAALSLLTNPPPCLRPAL